MAGVDQSIGEHDAMAGVDQSIGQHDMGHAAVQDVDNVPAADAGFTEVPGVGLSADYNADHTLGPSADHEYTHTVNHEYTHSAGHEYTPSTDFGFGHAGDLSLGNAGDVGIGHTGDGGLGHDGDGGIRDAGDGGIGHTGDDDVGHTGNHGVDNTAQDDVVHTENYGSDPAGDHGGNHSVEHPVDHATEHDTDHSIDQVPEDFQAQERQGHDGETVTGVGEKKWPGWPGESVFRMLVPAQKVGSIIGRKGEFIKKIVEETKARIKILDGPPGTTERAVLISAKEEPESSLPPAIDGLLTVHKRLIDGLEGESASTPPSTGPKVSTKMLVPASQAGSLIGKQGATVKSIQEEASCLVRVLGSENLPVFALQHDRVIEVVGEPIAVHKALELIASHLRKFLVDRSIIPLFEMQMQRPNPPMERMPPPHHQSWGPSQGLPPNVGGVGPGFGHNLPYMPPPPRQHDHYYPPADIPPMEKQPHQGISAYGREAPMGVHASSNAQAAPSMVTQITQEMQIPLSYADAVIGTAGSSISYIRRASGATVAIQESRGIPGEMTVEISGTASQVQTAQQLVQNFMAEAAAAAAPTQAQTGGSTDQAYNPYAAHDSAYASLPSNQGPTGHSGGYGSAYGSNYGY